MRAGGVQGGVLALGPKHGGVNKMTENPPKTKPIRDRRLSPRDWSSSDVPERQCTAHKRNGDRCKNAAIRGGNVCGYHGGNAPAVKAKARLRLEMASDRLARELLNMTTDPNVADPVKLAAIKDALDRSGIQAKTAVSVEVSTKPYELVFDRIGSAPTPPAPAIEANSLDASTDNQSAETVDSYQFPDEIDPESDELDAEVIDVEEDQPITPDQDDSSLSVDLGGRNLGPLGPNGPMGSGMLSLSDAVEAVSDIRAREAARLRDMRRR
jgi:hypothetical protein